MTKRKIIAFVAAVVMCMSLAACGKTPSYQKSMEQIRIFEEGFDEFMRDENSLATIVNTDDQTTPAGNNCHVRYFRSDNGVYESITLEVERGNFIQMDEYFKLSDGNVFVARSYFDPETHEPHVEKYILAGNSLYSIDAANETLTEVEDPASEDFFTDFQALVDQYSESSIATTPTEQ